MLIMIVCEMRVGTFSDVDISCLCFFIRKLDFLKIWKIGKIVFLRESAMRKRCALPNNSGLLIFSSGRLFSTEFWPFYLNTPKCACVCFVCFSTTPKYKQLNKNKTSTILINSGKAKHRKTANQKIDQQKQNTTTHKHVKF